MIRFAVLLFCAFPATITGNPDMNSQRSRRGSGATSFAASGTGVGTGNVFAFPAINPTIAFPHFGMNAAFQSFLDATNAAHEAVNRNAAFAAEYNKQMEQLANLQKMAQSQYPFAFPGFVFPNVVNPGLNPWNDPALAATLRMRTVPAGSDSTVFTSGNVQYGTPGGLGVASSYPGGPDGLGLRISEEFSAPSGSAFGTFSSSSSGISTVDGKTTSFKTSTIGVNDNGKIIFRTISD